MTISDTIDEELISTYYKICINKRNKFTHFMLGPLSYHEQIHIFFGGAYDTDLKEYSRTCNDMIMKVV